MVMMHVHHDAQHTLKVVRFTVTEEVADSRSWQGSSATAVENSEVVVHARPKTPADNHN